MHIETWQKTWCPSCNVPNWICQGNMSDLTVQDVMGVCCHSCNHEFILCEDEFIDPSEVDYEDGRAAPRGYKIE